MSIGNIVVLRHRDTSDYFLCREDDGSLDGHFFWTKEKDVPPFQVDQGAVFFSLLERQPHLIDRVYPGDDKVITITFVDSDLSPSDYQISRKRHRFQIERLDNFELDFPKPYTMKQLQDYSRALIALAGDNHPSTDTGEIHVIDQYKYSLFLVKHFGAVVVDIASGDTTVLVDISDEHFGPKALDVKKEITPQLLRALSYCGAYNLPIAGLVSNYAICLRRAAISIAFREAILAVEAYADSVTATKYNY